MKYRANTGLNWPTGDGKERRVEKDEICDDIPEKSLKWLLEQGLIEPAEEAPLSKKKTEKPVNVALPE